MDEWIFSFFFELGEDNFFLVLKLEAANIAARGETLDLERLPECFRLWIQIS